MSPVITKIDPEYLRRAAQAPDIAALKSLGLMRLRLTPGDNVLDIGCGPAIDTLAMGKAVGASGFVLGIDGDPRMVKEANDASVKAGMGAFVYHQAGDATRLAQTSESFDALYCERVLQHIPWAKNQAAVNEMLRVLTPGGRLVLVDTDWATLSVSSIDPIVERKVVYEHALGFANPYSGRTILSLVRNANAPVKELTAEPVVIRLPYESVRFLLKSAVERAIFKGSITWAESQRFTAGLTSARDYRVFCAHLTLLMVTAVKED